VIKQGSAGWEGKHQCANQSRSPALQSAQAIMGRKAPKADAGAGTAADGEPALTEAEKSSPVMRAVGKRVRAYRKKLNRIAAFEQMRQDGKELNSDQVTA